ncbi:MAG: hypothetical protein KGJ35_03305 [Patescibacteria group bacterium]|nr:hypothetical protein [Patescibacteria group bacterium]
MDTSLIKLRSLVSKSDFCILYVPFGGEIDPVTVPLTLPQSRAVIPLDKKIDAKTIGKEIIKSFDQPHGFILVPGKRFDRFGGRHGRGGGWYDRFLSVIPKYWVRIGVCSETCFTNSRLPLREWDESVDWVIVAGKDCFSFYETYARSNIAKNKTIFPGT